MRIAIILLLCLISVPLTLRKPVAGLAFYLGANIIRPEMLFWSGSDGNFVFKFWICLLGIAVLKEKHPALFSRPEFATIKLMLFMFAGIIISMLFSAFEPVESSYTYLGEIIKHIIFCSLIVILIRDFDSAIFLQKIMLGCFFVMGVWGIAQSLSGNERVEGLGGNAWPDSNFVAAIFVLFLPVALAYLFSARSRQQMLAALGLLAVMTVLIICTKSRAGTLGLLVCVTVFGYFTGRFKKIMAVLALMTVIIVPFMDETYFTRMQTLQSEEAIKSDASAHTRLVLWESAALIFKDNPLLGTGFFTFPEAKFQYMDNFVDQDQRLLQEVFRKDRKFVTHNTYLQMLAECGLLGALPFFVLLFSAIRHGLAGRKMLKRVPDSAIIWLCGVSAGICGFAVCILTLNAITTFMMYTQIIFASVMIHMHDKLESPQAEAA